MVIARGGFGMGFFPDPEIPGIFFPGMEISRRKATSGHSVVPRALFPHFLARVTLSEALAHPNIEVIGHVEL